MRRTGTLRVMKLSIGEIKMKPHEKNVLDPSVTNISSTAPDKTTETVAV